MVTDLEKCPLRTSKDEEVLEYLWLSARVHSFLRPNARGRGAGGGGGGVRGTDISIQTIPAPSFHVVILFCPKETLSRCQLGS